MWIPLIKSSLSLSLSLSYTPSPFGNPRSSFISLFPFWESEPCLGIAGRRHGVSEDRRITVVVVVVVMDMGRDESKQKENPCFHDFLGMSVHCAEKTPSPDLLSRGGHSGAADDAYAASVVVSAARHRGLMSPTCDLGSGSFWLLLCFCFFWEGTGMTCFCSSYQIFVLR